MQDEVNEKVVSLAIKTSKLTAEVLQRAMKALLAKGKGQLTKAPHGKITMRQLMKPGEKVSNIEITDQNIKAFDPIARKNGLDYNVKKIENGKPLILSILVDTFISKISLPMQPVPEIGSISVA